jgi:hypothetical protein
MPDKIINFILSGQDDFVWCPQGAHVVQTDDFDPRAGMCEVYISEAMAEMDAVLVRRGVVASAEEQEALD